MADRDLWWFSVALACDVLEVSTSGFYDWQARRGRPPTDREADTAALVAAIHTIYADNYGYGSPRVHAELVAAGWQVGKNRVARLMRNHGLVGRSGRKAGPTTTRPAKVAPDIPDRVQRRFDVAEPDTLWCTDLTYVPTGDGWLYLVTIIDAASRKIVGRAMADHMRTELMLEALTMALATRNPDPGLIIHSDRGAQYTSDAWLDALADADVLASMGRVGWCWDNALAEAWFATFKNELVYPLGAFDDHQHAQKEIHRYIRWHNRTRRHSALNMLSPDTWEQAHTLTLAA